MYTWVKQILYNNLRKETITIQFLLIKTVHSYDFKKLSKYIANNLSSLMIHFKF